MDELNITIFGKMYSCRYKIQDGLVTVYSSYGSKSTQRGGLPAMKVAELLLGEMVRTARNQ